MKTIRRGNDIQINWTITRLNGPESFRGKTVSVSLIDKFNNKQKFDYIISENIISGIFYGKDQTTCGTYRLLLIENEGESDMVTLDYIDCFLLSNKLKNHTAVGVDSSANINTEVIEVTSDVNLSGNGGDMSIYATKEYVNERISEVEGEIPTATSDLNNDSDFVADASYVHTDNNYTNSDKEKLGGIESGAEVNVQVDWNETNSSSDAYIQNKPSIPTATSDLNNDSDFVTSTDCVNIVALTQTEYDNLQTVSADTLYIIKPDPNA